MCTQYPEIIITSPKEPAAFCYVPQTLQENLLTTNYEQWCALYSMNDDDISLAYVSSNLQRQRQQQYQEEEDYEYGEEYRYEYDDFEDDDFFDKYQQPSRRQTLDDEFNNYNETHTQKYESYDNKEYEYYDDYENEEGFDPEFEYEYDEDYDEDIFYMEKEPVRPVSNNRPRLNYDILANAISRRFNNTTDSDVSEEEDSVVDEFDNETFEAKVVVKSTPSIKNSTTPSIKNISNSLSHRDIFQEEGFQGHEESEMHDFMETIKNKYSSKEISSSLPTKSGFSIMNDLFNDRSFGMPEAMSNKHGARNSLFTHRKSSSLQGSLLDKTLNGNNFSSMIKDSGMILSGPMKNRKRAFSLNEQNRMCSNKFTMNNRTEFSDLKKVLFCF